MPSHLSISHPHPLSYRSLSSQTSLSTDPFNPGPSTAPTDLSTLGYSSFPPYSNQGEAGQYYLGTNRRTPESPFVQDSAMDHPYQEKRPLESLEGRAGPSPDGRTTEEAERYRLGRHRSASESSLAPVLPREGPYQEKLAHEGEERKNRADPTSSGTGEKKPLTITDWQFWIRKEWWRECP
jgi:hypothetical protein